MITEIENVLPDIKPGMKIRCNVHRINNYPLSLVLEQMSRLFLFGIECDSNNTSSKAIPREVRQIRGQFEVVKKELEFAMQFNDSPRGTYEDDFEVSILDGKEIATIRNVKVKRFLSEMRNTALVMLGVDSSKSQAFIAQEDYSTIKEALVKTEAVLDMWIGTGADALNVGLNIPAFELLGEIRPDVDGNWNQMKEPTREVPLPELDDVKDIDPELSGTRASRNPGTPSLRK